VTAIDENTLPANARLNSIVFDDKARALRVVLRGQTEEQTLEAAKIAALFGGRIRHETTSIVSPGQGGINFGKLAITAATGIPVGMRTSAPKTKVVAGEELHYALAIRLDGITELWYLLATSFNFRKALGPESTYSMETNLRLFVKRLAAFAPGAVQDAFFAATIGGSPLPPPLDSLLDFFRLVAAR
jgi:hypothetical protein